MDFSHVLEELQNSWAWEDNIASWISMLFFFLAQFKSGQAFAVIDALLSLNLHL